MVVLPAATTCTNAGAGAATALVALRLVARTLPPLTLRESATGPLPPLTLRETATGPGRTADSADSADSCVMFGAPSVPKGSVTCVRTCVRNCCVSRMKRKMECDTCARIKSHNTHTIRTRTPLLRQVQTSLTYRRLHRRPGA